MRFVCSGSHLWHMLSCALAAGSLACCVDSHHEAIEYELETNTELTLAPYVRYTHDVVRLRVSSDSLYFFAFDCPDADFRLYVNGVETDFFN